MIERRMSVDEHGDPVLTIVATGWDGIRRVAEPLCTGTVEASAVGYRALAIRDSYLALKRLPVLRRTDRNGKPLSYQQLMTVADVTVSAWYAQDVVPDRPEDLLLASEPYTDPLFSTNRVDPELDRPRAADLVDVALRGAGFLDSETGEVV